MVPLNSKSWPPYFPKIVGTSIGRPAYRAAKGEPSGKTAERTYQRESANVR